MERLTFRWLLTHGYFSAHYFSDRLFNLLFLLVIIVVVIVVIIIIRIISATKIHLHDRTNHPPINPGLFMLRIEEALGSAAVYGAELRK